DMALLDAQRGQRLEPVGLDVERRAGCEDVLPQRDAVVGRRVDLVGELAREAEANEPHRHAVLLEFEAAHMRQGPIAEVGAGEGQPPPPRATGGRSPPPPPIRRPATRPAPRAPATPPATGTRATTSPRRPAPWWWS